MVIFPDGFALPAVPYLLMILLTGGIVAYVAIRQRPTITSSRVLALAPWMMLGAALHVQYVLNALPTAIRPLAGTPAVYLIVAIAAVGTWVSLESVIPSAYIAHALASVGTVAAVIAIAGVVFIDPNSIRVTVSVIGIGVSVILSGGVWVMLTRVVPETRLTVPMGAFAVFGHTLDAVSTAIGIDLLGFGERTPLSALIIEFAAGLPTEAAIGSGWLFIVVKILIVSVVVWVFADIADTAPTQSNILLTIISAVGFGPGVHNLLLFSVAG
jgi:Predicted membrane protein